MRPSRQRTLSSAIAQALPCRQHGFGLLGIIITAALGAAVAGVAYAAYRNTRVAADAADASALASLLGQRVQAAYAASSNFDMLSNTSALREGLYPKSALDSAKNPINPWGGSVQLAGLANGFALTFEGVPADGCPRFVTAAARGWKDVTINGSSIMRGHAVQTSAIGLLCSANANATVQFLAAKTTGAAPPTLTACVPSPPTTQTVPCPPGQISSVAPYSVNGVTQQHDSVCLGAYGLPIWTPWTTISNTCVPSCATQLAALTPNPETGSQTVPRSALCPSGQTGSDTWTQQQTQSRSATCAGPTPVSAPTWGAWSAWTDTGPRIGEVNTCSPTCATRLTTAPWQPNPATQTQTVPRSALCPSGQIGSDTWTQQQTQSRSATCAMPGAAVDPVWGAWSAWTDTGPRIGEVNTCAPVCSLPSPSTQYQTVLCPSGQISSVSPYSSYGVQQQRSAYCPAPTGAYAWGAWTTTSNTCASVCSAPGPTSTTQYQWDPVQRSAPCPSTYSGSHTWTAQQSRTATTSYSCPAPTGSYVTNPVSYSAWTDTGVITNEVNTCTPTATWSWQVDASGTYYNYEPSTPGNAPNVQYSGNYSAPTHPGCYTCWPVSNMDYTTCQVSLMMDSCTCDAGNAGAEFLEQWSDAGNGVGQNAYICSKS